MAKERSRPSSSSGNSRNTDHRIFYTPIPNALLLSGALPALTSEQQLGLLRHVHLASLSAYRKLGRKPYIDEIFSYSYDAPDAKVGNSRLSGKNITDILVRKRLVLVVSDNRASRKPRHCKLSETILRDLCYRNMDDIRADASARPRKHKVPKTWFGMPTALAREKVRPVGHANSIGKRKGEYIDQAERRDMPTALASKGDALLAREKDEKKKAVIGRDKGAAAPPSPPRRQQGKARPLSPEFVQAAHADLFSKKFGQKPEQPIRPGDPRFVSPSLFEKVADALNAQRITPSELVKMLQEFFRGRSEYRSQPNGFLDFIRGQQDTRTDLSATLHKSQPSHGKKMRRPKGTAFTDVIESATQRLKADPTWTPGPKQPREMVGYVAARFKCVTGRDLSLHAAFSLRNVGNSRNVAAERGMGFRDLVDAFCTAYIGSNALQVSTVDFEVFAREGKIPEHGPGEPVIYDMAEM